MTTIPQRLDKYELVERLGHGGTAEVWKAWDTQLQRFVAIKVLHPNLRDDPTFLVRFQREAQLIASLHHPNIVQIHDFQIFQPEASAEESSPTMQSIAYMVMDYIEGSTLADYIRATSRKGSIPSPTEIVNLFTSIGQAIDYAHSQGMIHRDIKPSNILLDRRNKMRNLPGEPILTDFGIAKLLNASSITQTGFQLGTPMYISPEQVQGRSATERSDLYSLAVILYEIVTGVVPFGGDSPIDIMTQHSSAAPTLPSLINPRLPSALDQVIMRGLAKDPEQRFPNAAVMVSAIAAAVAQIEQRSSASMPAITKSGPQSAANRQLRGTTEPMASGSYQAINIKGNILGTTDVIKSGQDIAMNQGDADRRTTNAMKSGPYRALNQGGSFPIPRTKSKRIIAIVGFVLIICLIAGLAGVFLVPGLLVPANGIVGQAFYVSSGQIAPGTAEGIADQMQVDLQNVPDPQPGKSYYLWLLGDKVQLSGKDLLSPSPIQPPFLLTNNLPTHNGIIHYFYSGDAEHNNLLAVTSRLLITEENANRTPKVPSTDRSTWRYFAMIPQQPIPGDPTGLNAVNHIRHLFYDETHLKVLALPGGLDFWLSRNTEKVLEWSVTARDDWYGDQTSDDQINLMRPMFVRNLDYLDGKLNFHVDIPANTPLEVDKTVADQNDSSVALLTVDPLRQGPATLDTNPPGYLDHIQLHVEEFARAPDVTPEMRDIASNILMAVKNAGKCLQQVRHDAVTLFNMGNSDPTQLRQPETGQLLDDMVTQATCAYIGQLDPVTNQTQPGVIQAHYDIQKLAVLSITRNLPDNL